MGTLQVTVSNTSGEPIKNATVHYVQKNFLGFISGDRSMRTDKQGIAKWSNMGFVAFPETMIITATKGLTTKETSVEFWNNKLLAVEMVLEIDPIGSTKEAVGEIATTGLFWWIIAIAIAILAVKNVVPIAIWAVKTKVMRRSDLG